MKPKNNNLKLPFHSRQALSLSSAIPFRKQHSSAFGSAVRIFAQVAAFLFLNLFFIQATKAQKVTVTAKEVNFVHTNLSEAFLAYEIYQVPVDEVLAIGQNKKQFNFELNLGAKHSWDLNLYESGVIGPKYREIVGSPDGRVVLPKRANISFFGTLNPGAGIVAITIDKNWLMGFVTTQGEKRIYIEPLSYSVPNAPINYYIVYRAEDAIGKAGTTCGAIETEKRAPTLNEYEHDHDRGDIDMLAACHSVDFSIASTFDMINASHNTAALVMNHVVSITTMMQVFYGFHAIQFQINDNYVSSSVPNDPLLPVTASALAEDLMENFMDWAQGGGFGTHDLAQLWTARNIFGCGGAGTGLIGCAWISGTCGNLRYNVCEDFSPTNLGCTAVLSAHEIAHNFGALHSDVDPAPNNIMGPFIDCSATGFGPNSQAKINAHTDGGAGACLGSCVVIPENDLCADAIVIDCSSSTTGTTTNATFDDVGFCGTSNTAPGVWYSFVGTGGYMELTTCNGGTNYDSKLSVFAGTCASLICVDGNDDYISCTPITRARVVFLSNAGTNYLVLVHGFSSNVGDFQLDLNCIPTIITSGTLSKFGTCEGTPSDEQSFTVAGITLVDDLIITAPAEFEISTISGSGFSSTVTLSPTGGSVPETLIYVRLIGTSAGNYSGDITCESAGASTQYVPVTGTVNPTPDVDQPENQTVCDSTETLPVVFTGSLPSLYNWTNDNTSIGLGASGTGNIPSFIAVNPGNVPAIANVTVTPGPVNLISNGDFETGDLTGWTSTPTSPWPTSWAINDSTLNPPGPGDSTAVITGNYDIVAIQGGSGTNLLSAPITLSFPMDTVILSWDDRIMNYCPAGSFGYYDPQQEFRVELLDNAMSLITTVYSTNPGDALLQPGPNHRSFDVSTALAPYAGQQIYVHFIVEAQYCYFNVTLDNISLYDFPGCIGEPKTFTYTVNPTPDVTIPNDTAVCNGTLLPVGTFNFISSTSGGASKILIVYADLVPPLALQSQLAAKPGVTQVDLFDASINTPSLLLLVDYDLVVPFSNSAYGDEVAVGDVMADYQDNGGTVVGLNFDWFGLPFGMAGRWMTGGYSPFNDNAIINYTNGSLGLYTAGHPLMQGVSTLDAYYRQIVTVAPGATQVAAWNDGGPLIAYKGKAVGISAYLGENLGVNFSGDFAKVIVNARNANTVINWTNDNINIGLAASGSGNTLPEFTATNPSNAPISATITVWASYTNGGVSCTGPSKSFIITVLPSPKPICSCSNPAFCAGKSAVLDAGAGYTKYLWSNGKTTRKITVTTAGTWTVTVTNANGCTGSGSITTTVYPLPNVSFSGLAASYPLNTSPVTLTGSPSGGIFAGPGSSIVGNKFYPANLPAGGPYTITYTYKNSHGCSKTVSHQTTIINCLLPGKPGSIYTVGGATKVCPGESKNYYINAVPLATSYLWIAPTGASVTGGQGSTAVTVHYSNGFSANGNLSVVAVCACGQSPASTLLMTKNSKPATPSAITGINTGTCQLNLVPYSVTNVAGVTYNWSFGNAYANVTNGQGSNAVQASFGPLYKTGYISVSATNSCGTSGLRKLTVSAAPAKPGAITGSPSVCANATLVPYSISPVAAAQNYTWFAPAGSTIKAGTTTSPSNTIVTTYNSVKVNFGSTTGTVMVRANNACSSSAYASLNVNVGCREDGITLAEEFNVTCYPMPAKAELNVLFRSGQEAVNSIRIIDVIGKTLLQQLDHSVIGENHYILDVATLSSGIYMIEVINGDQVSVQKIMIE